MDAQPKRNAPKPQPGWWWIISGPVIFAAIGVLGALYFLPQHCVKRTFGEICFDCLKTREYEVFCWVDWNETVVSHYPWFSYHRAPGAGDWEGIHDPRQAGCRHRYVISLGGSTTYYGPFFVGTGWVDGLDGELNDLPERREMQENILVRVNLLSLHGDALDAATRERFLATIHDSLGQHRDYEAARVSLWDLPRDSGREALEAWLQKYFGPPAPAPPSPAAPRGP